MSTLRIIFLLFLTAHGVTSKSYTSCELANELIQVYNFTFEETKNLICIAKKLSNLNTNVIGGDKYGIFQINHFYCNGNNKNEENTCDVKCEDLLNDDISDDIECTRKILSTRGLSAWRYNKKQGCHKILDKFDKDCNKKLSKKEKLDRCEYAKKLSSSYGISKLDALIWSCISESNETQNGNVHQKFPAAQFNDLTCVKNHDVECAIKNRKQAGMNEDEFDNWFAYKRSCKNVNNHDVKKCFKDVDVVFPSTKKAWIFTTSTEISIVEDDDESSREKVYLNKSPAFKSLVESTIEGYSKVRIMKAEEKKAQSEATTTEFRQIQLIAKSHLKDDKFTTQESFPDSSTTSNSYNSSTFSLNTITTKPDSFDDLSFDDDWFKDEITEKYEVSNNYEKIDKCDLARYTKESGRIPQNLISKFLCIAENESQLNISLANSTNGVSRYGLFQIDDQIYCNTNEKINECDVPCEHFLDDQFDNDLECVAKILEKEGFNYWTSYSEHCTNVDEKSIDYCFVTSTTTHRPFTIINSEIIMDSITKKFTTETPKTNETSTVEQEFLTDEDVIRHFDFCDLAQQLHLIENVPLDILGQVMCVANKSNFNIRNLNESANFLGLFSFKADVCGWEEAGGKCLIKCSDLLDYDISDDTRCFKQISLEEGPSSWNLHINDCSSFNSKILQCIDEGKFEIPVEGDMYSMSNRYDEDYNFFEADKSKELNQDDEDVTTKSASTKDETTTKENSDNISKTSNQPSYFKSIFEIFTTLNSSNDN